ncbi:unnamed protein product, partial [Rotaria sp. Silwood1]
MASSNGSEKSTTPSERLGAVFANVLQEQLLDGTDNVAQTATSNAREVVSDLDNLILPNIIGKSTLTAVDDTRALSEPSLAATATSFVDALNELNNDLSSICDPISTSIATNSVEFFIQGNNTTASLPPTPIGQSEAQTPTTIDDNRQVEFKSGRHIMISYHHDSSFHISQRICTQLRSRGCKVWMDTNNLHGSIHEGMAEAVENSYIVLFCMNHHYFESEFCQKEALYTDKRRIDFIPCLLEKGYEPKGWLGILIRDKLYIDFSSSDNFDMVFEELVAEIQ